MMLISHQEKFISGQPNASAMTVPENISICRGVVSLRLF
jgi:hypothetical protein